MRSERSFGNLGSDPTRCMDFDMSFVVVVVVEQSLGNSNDSTNLFTVSRYGWFRYVPVCLVRYLRAFCFPQGTTLPISTQVVRMIRTISMVLLRANCHWS